MTTKLYLAITAAEIQAASPLPSHIAWMACHFCPYSTGLSNLPETLPEGAVLMLNDITPIRGHDPDAIRDTLYETVRRHRCNALVLDFQRHPCAELQVLAQHLTVSPPCPVAVSAPFAVGLACPVFLPPCPANVPLEAHTAPWNGRDIWLEVSRSGMSISVTASGAVLSASSFYDGKSSNFVDESLHCHYRIETAPEQIRFTLWRTDGDIRDLCLHGSTLGIRGFLGLYQELDTLTLENENRSA